MSTHEFGIMESEPSKETFFDVYKPQKYKCISIKDGIIESLSKEFLNFDMYWHTRSRLEKGLAYSGITLIPPSSIESILLILKDQNINGLEPLNDLFYKAKLDDKYVIHFGL